MINKKFKKIVYPTKRKIDKDFYKILERKGIYQRKTRDPLLEDLQSYSNVTMIQDALCEIMKYEYNIYIPKQEYRDIREAIRQQYVDEFDVSSKILFSRMATSLRRSLQGDQAQLPFNDKHEYKHSKFLNKKFPSSSLKKQMSIKNFKKDFNNKIIKTLVKLILFAIQKKQKYIKYMKKSYPDKIISKLKRRGKVVVRKKEIEKFNGKDHSYNQKIWKIRPMPRFKN